MDRVLGLIVLVFYVVSVMGFAGLVTYAVIKIFPTKDQRGGSREPDMPSEDGSPAGRLFRRAKREASA